MKKEEKMLFLFLFLAVFYCAADATTCDPDYQKIGCFKRTPTLLHDLLVNDRDPTHANFSGQLINWNDYGNYLHSLACRCSEKVRKYHYRFFAIGFYGECFAGHDSSMFEQMLKTGLLASQDCVDGEYAPCDQFSPMECSGKGHSEYIYKLNNPPVRCDLKPGDGVGSGEISIGIKGSLKECIDACLDLKDEFPDVNGVTILSSGVAECFCERGQTGRNSSPRWRNCLLEM
ncbi:uncharacterized protein LOC130621632 [Hydractinia symbiolongicarpus]|uniref:uncharacterized protein LOC130621632 n=1 Tax=Hydractinia symbiolongicarpus TaxID=13093 RepID=UPI00254B0A18|nr:uncharacterized protein LOC130621632 [Hydractinia symbiolongicarpus]